MVLKLGYSADKVIPSNKKTKTACTPTMCLAHPSLWSDLLGRDSLYSLVVTATPEFPGDKSVTLSISTLSHSDFLPLKVLQASQLMRPKLCRPLRSPAGWCPCAWEINCSFCGRQAPTHSDKHPLQFMFQSMLSVSRWEHHQIGCRWRGKRKN